MHPDIDDKLFDIALKAYAKANNKPVAYYDDKDKPLAVIFAPERALDAANHFVSEKAFETSLPDFRRLIADTGKASLKKSHSWPSEKDAYRCKPTLSSNA